MKRLEHAVVAIDGPAASGKSTVSRRLARQLGFSYVNSGGFYRAVTWLALELGCDPVAGAGRILAALQQGRLTGGLAAGASWVAVDGKLMEGELASERVNAAVSAVSALPEIRAWLLGHLRALADEDCLVMEGRDIGSVVFPDTPHKFYLDACPEVRAGRRRAQGIGDHIAQRDRIDSSRKAAPLSVAPDAVVVDSSNLSLDQVVNSIIEVLAARGVVR